MRNSNNFSAEDYERFAAHILKFLEGWTRRILRVLRDRIFGQRSDRTIVPSLSAFDPESNIKWVTCSNDSNGNLTGDSSDFTKEVILEAGRAPSHARTCGS